MIKTRVEAGICGFITEIEASTRDFQNVSFKINSQCENINKLAGEIPAVDAFQEIKDGFNGKIFTITRNLQKSNCSGCVVPCAIFKTMQAAANLALPKNASIDISRTD